MQITLEREKASSIFIDGKFYDTGKPLEVSFSEAFRLSKITNAKKVYDIVEYDPSLWKDRKFVNFSGDIDMTSGFGGVSYNLIKYSTPSMDIALAGRTLNVHDSAVLATKHKELNQAGAMIWHDQPRDVWAETPFKKNICIIPFETTQIPKSWLLRINSFDALFVPCKQNIKAFRDSGVKIPIELIHWGIDPKVFYPLVRPERPVFTFGHMGALSPRKGTDILVDAFSEEFKTEQDVRLICKTSYNGYPFMNKDKRIEVQISTITHEELMQDFFQRIDCFVFPTRGEGFGLTPLEAMATGVPAIVTGWAGPLEYMTPDVGWLIDYKMTPAESFNKEVYKEQCGDWAEPDKEHLKSLMRYAYEHRAEVREKGRLAALHVQQNWLWQDKIKLFHEALDKHL